MPGRPAGRRRIELMHRRDQPVKLVIVAGLAKMTPVTGGTAWAATADCRKGRRPNFMGAAPGEKANELFGRFLEMLRGFGCRVETGVFAAMMDVHLINDGPVTIILDSADLVR